MTTTTGQIESPASPVPRRGPHLPVLDGVRGLAILLVVLTHYLQTDYSSAFNRLLSRVGAAGWCGVDLFFVLSGFLITGILYDARSSRGFFRNFYARRTLRIFPLYYGVLVALLVIAPALSADWARSLAPLHGHEWALWLYCTNIVVSHGGAWVFKTRWISLDHFWSLAVEEQFYLVWPVFVLLLPRRALIGCCVAAVAIALGLRIWWGQIHYDAMSFYVLTPSRMDALALGALVALFARGRGGMRSLLRPAQLIAGVSGASVMIVFLQQRMWSTSVPAVRTVGITLLAAFFAASLVMIVLAAPTSILHRVFTHPVLRVPGKYSYALYVFHPMLLPLMLRATPPAQLDAELHSAALGHLAFLVMGAAGSFALALVSWHCYEKWFLLLKRFFESAAPARTVQLATA